MQVHSPATNWHKKQIRDFRRSSYISHFVHSVHTKADAASVASNGADDENRQKSKRLLTTLTMGCFSEVVTLLDSSTLLAAQLCDLLLDHPLHCEDDDARSSTPMIKNVKMIKIKI